MTRIKSAEARSPTLRRAFNKPNFWLGISLGTSFALPASDGVGVEREGRSEESSEPAIASAFAVPDRDLAAKAEANLDCNVATSSSDADMHTAIAEGINGIAKTVEALVVTFNELLSEIFYVLRYI